MFVQSDDPISTAIRTAHQIIQPPQSNVDEKEKAVKYGTLIGEVANAILKEIKNPNLYSGPSGQ